MNMVMLILAAYAELGIAASHFNVYLHEGPVLRMDDLSPFAHKFPTPPPLRSFRSRHFHTTIISQTFTCPKVPFDFAQLHPIYVRLAH